MAEPKYGRLFLVSRPAVPPPEPPRTPVHDIARQALDVARECARALQTYHAEVEMYLCEMSALMNELELAAIRAMKRGAR